MGERCEHRRIQSDKSGFQIKGQEGNGQSIKSQEGENNSKTKFDIKLIDQGNDTQTDSQVGQQAARQTGMEKTAKHSKSAHERWQSPDVIMEIKFD